MNYSKMTKKRKTMLCAMVSGALLLQMPGISHAEEQNEYTLDQMVVTANRIPSNLSEAAANVSVITREDIEKGNYKIITDVLKHVPGVALGTQGFSGGEQHVVLNGDERVIIMIDGRRINLSKSAGHYGRSSYNLNNFPSLDNVERIEIVKGAASAQYGSDAVGGVINIITRRGTENKTTMDISTGSWGTRNYNFTTSGQEKNWQWFVTADRAKQDHFAYKNTNGQKITMPNSAYKKDGVTVRLDKNIDKVSSLTFNFEHADDHKGQPWGAPNPITNAYRDTLTNNWALTYNYDKTSELPAYFRMYQNYEKVDITSGQHLMIHKESGAEWQDGWKLDDQNLLVSGVQWRDVDVKNRSAYGNKGINNKSVYLEDRMNLDKKWTFIPGMRYDNHNMFGGKTTPRASVNYHMDDKTDIYLSWGEVFKAPTIDDLFYPYQDWGTSTVAGNPNLKPETGHTTTLGINKKLSNITELKASYFQSELKDAINWEQIGIHHTPSNVDSMKKKGAEIEVRSHITPNWSVLAGYSYLQMKSKAKSGDYVQDTSNPEPNGYNLGINYTKDAWNIDLTGTGASGRSLKKFTSSSYWIWDLSVNYDITKNARTYFKVNNITDEAYETWGHSTIGNFPMPGRNYQMGLQYKF